MSGLLIHGAKFHASIEVHRMKVPQFKFICPDCGESYGGKPEEYFQMPETAVFECCGVPSILAEHVNVTIWQDGVAADGHQDGAFLQTWESVAEPVTLAEYRKIYKAAHKRA